MPIADDELMAFADGELDAGRRSEIERALEGDAQLALRLQAQLALRERVHDAFAGELDEPVPASLMQALQAGAAPVEPARASAAPSFAPVREASNDPRWGWRRWGGLAAALLVGLLVGRTLPPSPSPSSVPLGGPAGEVVADAALERALSTQLAEAGQAADVRVPISFVDRSGRYCRAFATARQSGLACRDDERWRVTTLVDTPVAAASAASSDVRQAASALPARLLDEIDARIAGAPLDAAQEHAARDARWRR